MRLFFDTNVLVAAFVQAHPLHSRALVVFSAALKAGQTGLISAHTLLELHSALTQLPEGLALPPYAVRQLISENIKPHFTLVTLSPRDYEQLQIQAAERGLIGGIIYDYLQIACAIKAKAQRCYTFDLRHFERIAPPEFLKLVVVP